MIQVENLTKRYGDFTAVKDVSFSVEKGEIVGFLGKNGAGKSTTMRILTGSLGATDGRALVGGHDVFRAPQKAKRLIGYLPEVPPLYVDMTVRGYLRFAARVKGAANPNQAVEKVIERVGLTDVAHRLIDHLSKGYRQRVGIAQAMVHDPQVLILDEPSSGLDPAQRKEIRDLVQELSAGETTVILSTHVLPEVEAICDRVLIVDKGQIVARGTLDEIAGGVGQVVLSVQQPDGLADKLAQVGNVEAVSVLPDGRFRVTAGGDVRAEVARVAVAHGLLELTGQKRLEDVFLQLTGEA